MTTHGPAQRPAAVLVTGMSGTGKSSALAALAARGNLVLDTDEPGWKREVPTPAGPEPHLQLDRLRARLDTDRSAPLFVAACTIDQRELYDRFDAVVLLRAPLGVLLVRVTDRSNPFGATAHDRTRIAADLAEVEPLLRAGATHEIDATAPLADVVDALARIAGAPPLHRHPVEPSAGRAVPAEPTTPPPGRA